MIIPKDATPPARGEADAFHTPKTLVVAGLGALTLAATVVGA